MIARLKRSLVLLGACSVLAGCVTGKHDDFRILVFSKTTGYRHASITNGIAAIRELGVSNHFEVNATEDASVFTTTNLNRYQAVVFLSTTGNVLDQEEKAAFANYIRAGHGFVGIHSASDTEYGWPWYGGLVGAYFRNHPVPQTATLTVEDHTHPSTSFLLAHWVRKDEWYCFRTNPRPSVHVLLSVDEHTYEAGTNRMGADHPIAWCHAYEGGRAWYTALGHPTESYSDPVFLAHILGGIKYAAGVVACDCSTNAGH